MTKPDIDIIRNDSKSLSHAEFKKKYPGVNPDEVQKLNDADLEKIAGGARGELGNYAGGRWNP